MGRGVEKKRRREGAAGHRIAVVCGVGLVRVLILILILASPDANLNFSHLKNHCAISKCLVRLGRKTKNAEVHKSRCFRNSAHFSMPLITPPPI